MHLHPHNLRSVVSSLPLLSPTQAQKEAWKMQFVSLSSSCLDFVTPEELSRQWHIGMDIATQTLKATTHQFLRTTGTLDKRFCTDKAHLQYKHLMKLFRSFYCNYLKPEVKSIQFFIHGVVYTNQLAFYKLFPCSTETSIETGQTLCHFLHVVGLPHSLYPDNHANLKEGLFTPILRMFGIPQTFTESHSPWQNFVEPAIYEIK